VFWNLKPVGSRDIDGSALILSNMHSLQSLHFALFCAKGVEVIK
jgi:hypothetical protein